MQAVVWGQLKMGWEGAAAVGFPVMLPCGLATLPPNVILPVSVIVVAGGRFVARLAVIIRSTQPHSFCHSAEGLFALGRRRNLLWA